MSRLIAFALALLVCAAAGAQPEAAPPLEAPPQASKAPPGDAVDIDGLLAKLSIRQKIGQMFTVGFTGPEMNEAMRALVEEDCVGGFFIQVLENFTFPEECAALTSAMQRTALASAHGIPLFVAMDMEGGVAAPLHYMLGATPTPGNMALGASGREQDAYMAYNTMAHEMRLCGANVNYAPALDVLTSPKNPDYTVRSFGGDMASNGILARGAFRGSRDAGVVACAKHFPGLACYDEDTHDVAPHLTQPEAEIMAGDLGHWRGPIAAGLDMIMTAHVYVHAWDIDHPVTLSSKIIQGVARDKLGFDGVILTDSMGMGALGKDYSMEDATVLAVKAGCDRVLQVSRNINELHRRINAVLESFEAGEIEEAFIDAAVRRSLRLKAKYRLFSAPLAEDADAVLAKLRQPELLAGNQKAALNGVVTVRDEAGLLPVSPSQEDLLVICPPGTITRAGKGTEVLPVGHTLGRYIRQRAEKLEVVTVDTTAPKGQARYALEKAEDADLIILGQLLAHQSPEQVAFIKKVLALDKPTIVVNLGVPSDLALFPEAKTFVTANGPAPINCEAAAKVLFGEAQSGGKLSMPIGDLYAIGHAGP